MTKVDLIRRLPIERAVRHHCVVLLDVEGDQAFECGNAVERVQIQPGYLVGQGVFVFGYTGVAVASVALQDVCVVSWGIR